MEQSVCDKACTILQKTNDGDDLAPRDLKLVEMAVNGFLNEEGGKAFNELHASVLSGYKPPWLHGVEHLTIDHVGYVYWKGQQVEHFTYYDKGSYKKLGAYAVELGQRCLHLESINVEISVHNLVWAWEKYAPAPEKASHGV